MIQGIPLPSDSAYKYGPGWTESYRYVIPLDWEPGVYRAQFLANSEAPTRDSRLSNINFIVRPAIPGSLSDILFVICDNTFQSYNNWGGKSTYEFQSTDSKRAYIVSFNRPINQYFTTDYVRYVEPFRSWLYQQGVQYIPEFAFQYDIESIPNLFQNYKLVLFVGHDEYWTRNQLNAVKNYVNQGGTVGIFSGNTSWWQVRYEDNGRTLVSYKSDGSGITADPLFGTSQDSLVTVNFFDNPVYYPENQATGLGWRKGGYVQRGSLLPTSAGWGGYNDLFNTQSWVYRGTGLTYGDTLGKRTGPGELGIVGYEVDGCEFTGYVSGNPTAPLVTGTDGTPLTYKILGLSQAYYSLLPDRHAVMGMYRTKGGGWVFNAATIYWSYGLQTTYYGQYIPEVRTITKNVIDKFLRLSRIP